MRCVISDAIEKVFVSFFYYFCYRRFVSRVQILPTAATQKTFKALPVRFSVYFCMTLTQAAVDVVKSNIASYTELLNVKLF